MQTLHAPGLEGHETSARCNNKAATYSSDMGFETLSHYGGPALKILRHHGEVLDDGSRIEREGRQMRGVELSESVRIHV